MFYRDAFVSVFSVTYGIGILMISIIVNFFGLFGLPSYYSGDIFNTVLSIIGIIIISWLMFDIYKYLVMMQDDYQNGNKNDVPIKLIESEDGELIISIPLDIHAAQKTKKLPQYYCFSTERHTGSFFLKIGAALFCVGHIVHLMVAFSILVYTQMNITSKNIIVF